MSKRSWTDEELIGIIPGCFSYRMVIMKLGLVPAGGNYDHVRRIVKELGISTKHFTSKGWNGGWRFDPRRPARNLNDILVQNIQVQSHKLKLRLIREGYKKTICELCGWCQKSVDGRVPIELDHINGDHNDNRIDNLRILCPNCHSLQPTHRGKNKKSYLARVL